MKKTHLLVLALLLLLAASAGAQQIVQSRGVDSRIDYVKLTQYGPWDDRNYQLTQSDLELLAAGELERRPGVPLFYRIEMLRAMPELRDPERRYPRSALNKFIGKYGGFLVEGKLYRSVEAEGHKLKVDFDKGVKKEDFDELGHEAFAKVNGWRLQQLRVGAETAVKIHPTDPDLAVAGINDAQFGIFGQTMAFSRNGGRTWAPSTGAVPLAGSCCDPTVDWSSDGSVAYAATLSLTEAGVFFYRSANGGETWDDLPGVPSRTELDESGADKEFLHVDKHPDSPFIDNVYLCWHVGNVQRFGVSTDRGETFNKRTIAGGGRRFGIGCDLTSDKEGNLYYFWPAFRSRRILFRKSLNGGESFRAVKELAPTEAAFDYPIPAMHQRRAFVYVATDVDLSDGPFANTVYVAWSDTYDRDGEQQARNHSRVQVAFSRDGGDTWTITNPHRTNDANQVDRFHPWLAVDPEGTVHVIYYDTERSANRRSVDVVHAISKNGGQAWTTRRATASPSLRVSDGFQFGDYNGLDATAIRLMGTWTATDNGEAVGEVGRRNN